MIKGDSINIPKQLIRSALSMNAKWLYLSLLEMEMRLCEKHGEPFIQRDIDICNVCGFSLATLKRAKRELRTSEFISCWVSAVPVNKYGELTREHYTHYRINEV